MNQNTNQIFFALLRSAICGSSLGTHEKELFSVDLLPELLAIAKIHDIANLIASAIKNNNLINGDEALEKSITSTIYQSVMRYEKLNYHYEKLCRRLEDAQIPFIPLKGSVIRKYYSEPWMRTSSDIDILLRYEDLESTITYLKGIEPYRELRETIHDVSLFSKQGVHLELHYDLVEDWRANDASKVLKQVWKNVSQKDGYKYWYEMSDEYFYFYHIAHMAKHFEEGGCGIRPFIDLWILDNLENVDKNKRDDLLKQGGLLKFAQTARDLSKCWFEGNPFNDVTLRMQDFIINGGVYGSVQNKIDIQKERQGGQIGYTLSRFFIPYDEIKKQYPFLEKHRCLTPVMEIYRLIKIVFDGNMKRVIKQVNHSAEADKEIMTLQELLQHIGL